MVFTIFWFIANYNPANYTLVLVPIKTQLCNFRAHRPPSPEDTTMFGCTGGAINSQTLMISQVLEDCKKNLPAEAFFSYFPSKTKVITVKN